MELIHPLDREDIQNILGDVPTAIENEYLLRLRMKHRAGTTGRLGLDAVVDMLRFLNYEPPEVVGSQPKRTDWRTISQGSQVIASVEDGDREAEFVRCGKGGLLIIRFPGEQVLFELPAHAVKLIASEIPADLDLDSLSMEEVVIDARMQRLVEAMDEEEEEEESVTPPVTEEDWGALASGDPILYGEESDNFEGTFVCVGPQDFEITIQTKGGENIVLPEAAVTMPEAGVTGEHA